MIYVECYADETLVQVVTKLPRRQIGHELKGKYGVAERLVSRSNVVGMIDEDPGKSQPRYLNGLHVAREIEEFGLRLLSDPRRGNHVVLLQPRLEEWVLTASQRNLVDIRDFGLPRNASELHGIGKSERPKLEKLFGELDRLRSPWLTNLGILLIDAHRS
ncbi:MAG: hypothetical protein HY681_09720 [Chloroflexi bacterium]|nr:hypothetical protein [Chloroflexota bacterium]